MADLDTIMSGSGSDSVTEQTPAVVEQTTEGQPRDPHGRFAPIEQTAEQAAQPAAVEQQEQRPPDGYVPIQALDARLAKQEEKLRKDYEARLTQERLAWQQQLVAFQPQRQQPEPVKPPDWYESPDAALDFRVQPQIREAIDPIRHSLMANARLVAETMHGRDTFNAAVQAFDEAVATGQIDPRDFQRVSNSPNPFHEAVLWKQRNAVLNEVGSDPVAYRERLRKELMAELQQGQHQQQHPTSQQPPVLPTSFAGARNAGPNTTPGFSGPRPLSDIMGGR